ncbi:MAG TPA: hypothetical protein VMG10_33205 [Gemmataceae bacterium]|nr:hypothetical protein [Gemmataceae bacterium]
MIDDPSLIVPHVVAAEASTPAPEVSSGEATLPAPTAEQAQTADRVFGASTEPNPICSMLGIATSFMLLRDVAVDTFDTSGEEEEEKANQKLGKDKDVDCTD